MLGCSARDHERLKILAAEGPPSYVCQPPQGRTLAENIPETGAMLAARYRLVRVLGKGAAATVYLARDTVQDRDVAVKILARELTEAVGHVRFVREIRVAGGLTHPHLLSILDSGESDGVVYYVTPYLTGGSLRTRIEREKQLPLDEALEIGAEIGDALSFIHDQGVVHRDVKPENVLFAASHACLGDFGIARVLDSADSDTITSTGMAVGTPAYMSPEQASGAREIDPRSDQYSLACLIYEMLAGVPPFTGATAQSVIAQRFMHEAIPVTRYRASVPKRVETALTRALARDRADRFASVAEFVAALGRGRIPPVTTAEIATPARSRRRARTITAGALAALALLIIAAAAVPASRERIGTLVGWNSADSTAYAVVPFRPTEAGMDAMLGNRIASALRASLTGWSGITVVDDGSPTIGRNAGSARDAADAARRLGAGRVVFGTFVTAGDSLMVLAELLDTRTSQAIARASRSVAVTAGLGAPAYTELVARLLGPGDVSRPLIGDPGTRSYSAWKAFGNALSALGRWDLAGGERWLIQALAADDKFAAAHAWLAQVRMWRGQSAAAWADHAARAAGAAASLSPRDRAVAEALRAISRGEYPKACEEYSRMVASDSLDAAGWLGLGECRYLDSRVVVDRSSPSGWKFRSGYEAASQAYLRAVAAAPGVRQLPIYERLTAMLPTDPKRLRRGRSDAPPTNFAAYVSAGRDTVAFVPYPLASWSSGAVRAPASRGQALELNRGRLLAFALAWVGAEPRNPDAFVALADVREARGELEEEDARGPSALESIRRARALATSSAQLPLAGRQVRIMVKTGRFKEARLLGDTLLSRYPDAQGPEATELQGIAALLGKAQRAGALWALAGDPDLMDVRVPPQLHRAEGVLFAHAALGVCGSIDSLDRAFRASVDRYIPPVDAKRVYSELAAQAIALAGPCDPRFALRIAGSNNLLLARYRLLADGDRRAVRADLDRAAAARAALRPGDLSLDFTFHESWLRLAIGDTAGSVSHLDRALEALPAHGTTMLAQLAEAGALVRAMALRADLASARGEGATARRWAQNVAEIWAGADPGLLPLVRRMAQLGIRGLPEKPTSRR